MPKVSIIIPTYNHAEYVTRAINSALAQTYKNFEIIIVDDGSTDNTREVLTPYMDKIKYICQENKGPAGARNTGIKNSSGEYLQFLDADDELLPRKLEFQMGIMEKHPEINITACGWQLFDKKRYPLVDLREYGKRIITMEDILLADPFVTEALIFKKECFSNAGVFDESIRFCEDKDMWLRLSVKGYKFYCYNQKLVNIYRILGSESYNNPDNMNVYLLKILYKFFALSDLNPEIIKLKNEAYFSAYRSCAWAYYGSGNLYEGRKCLIEMIKLIPGILVENRFFYQLDNFFKPFGYINKKTSLKAFYKVEKEIFTLLVELYNNKNVLPVAFPIKKRVYSNAYLGISIKYFEYRKTKEFLGCFIKAFTMSPDFVSRSIWIYPYLKSLLCPLALIIKLYNSVEK